MARRGSQDGTRTRPPRREGAALSGLGAPDATASPTRAQLKKRLPGARRCPRRWFTATAAATALAALPPIPAAKGKPLLEFESQPRPRPRFRPERQPLRSRPCSGGFLGQASWSPRMAVILTPGSGPLRGRDLVSRAFQGHAQDVEPAGQVADGGRCKGLTLVDFGSMCSPVVEEGLQPRVESPFHPTRIGSEAGSAPMSVPS